MGVRVVTMHSRPGCHLCEIARAELEELRHDLPPFELRETDIESDDSLLARYLERIPVFELDGRVVCELGLDARALRRCLMDTLTA